MSSNRSGTKEYLAAHEGLMICNSTGNQTVNLIPAVQWNVSQVSMVSTDQTDRNGATTRLMAALADFGIAGEVIRINRDEEKDLARLRERLLEACAGNPCVLWNISGGQKIPTMALYEAFRARIGSGFGDDRIIYLEANPPGIWSFGADLVAQTVPARVELRLEQLLGLYNSSCLQKTEIYPNPSEVTAGDLETGRKALECYLTSDGFREAFFKYMKVPQELARGRKEIEDLVRRSLNELKPRLNTVKLNLQGYEHLERDLRIIFRQLKSSSCDDDLKDALHRLKVLQKPEVIYNDYWDSVKKRAIESVIGQLGNTDEPLLKKNRSERVVQEVVNHIVSLGGAVDYGGSGPLLKGQIRRFSAFGNNGTLFEWMVAASVCNEIAGHPGLADAVSQVHLNVITRRADQPDSDQDAEMDVVITTRWGTLLVLEAKTYQFSGDTAEGRESIAYKKSGPYGKAIMVGPLIKSIVKEKTHHDLEVPPYIDGPTKDQKKTAWQHNVEYVYCDEIPQALKKELRVKD